MYQVSVESHFDCAHYLREYHGKCESLHGHRYKVVVSINAHKLDDGGLAYDFTELKQKLNNIISKFDHNCLNDIPPFNRINPSAENISKVIYDELKPALPVTVSIASVKVWETPHNCVTYYPE